MSFKDFLKNWHQVQICHLSASSFSDEINDAADVSYLSNNLNTSTIKISLSNNIKD
jgi:hypothetical protein